MITQSDMQLVPPSAEYKESFIDAVREYQASEANMIRAREYRSLATGELEKNFDAYVANERSKAEGRNLPDGWVPQTTLWLIDGGEFIGRVSIRHRLTEALTMTGGHIGYNIRPSKRGGGYGTAILRLALPVARALGITHVLITCDTTNTASRKIIERNGGILENSMHDMETGAEKLRFWVDNV